MSRRGRSVVCRHAVRLEWQMPLFQEEYEEEFLLNDWIMIASGAEVTSKNATVYASQYIKVIDGKAYCINLVNESEDMMGGGVEHCVFAATANDVDDFIKGKQADEWEYGETVPSIEVGSFAGGSESVVMFCRDFGISVTEIEDVASVRQTL